jgi:hypothetical protein
LQTLTTEVDLKYGWWVMIDEVMGAVVVASESNRCGRNNDPKVRSEDRAL